MNRTTRALAALTLTLALPLTATACGGEDPGAEEQQSGETTAEHNDADVAFATEMIQHHAQALSMVDLTLDRPLDPEVADLAEQIREAQGPEIETMADWLQDWGEEVPETMRDHSNMGHDMDDMSGAMEEGMEGMEDMPGMMSAEEMTALADSSDAEFQDRWLQMMIEHHEGAIEMAETEQTDGAFGPAVDLAGGIVEGQGAEIETMQGLLGS